MMIKSYHKGRTVKTLVVKVEDNETVHLSDILAFAQKHAGETPTSLFGHNVSRGIADKSLWDVKLYTD